MNEELIDELLELEKCFWDAAGNAGFYAEHFAQDGLIALAMGVMGQAEVMEAMESADPWTEHSLDSPRLVEISPDVAALVYRASARRAGDRSDYEVVVSSVYVRRSDRWKLILHQQTPRAAG